MAPKGFKTDIDSLALRFVGERLAETWKSFAAKIGLRSFTWDIQPIIIIDRKILFVPSHSKPVFGREEAFEKIRKFIEKFDERERKILELLEEPKTIDELVEATPIYGKKPYAKDMLEHIDKLLREGKIKKEGNFYIKI